MRNNKLPATTSTRIGRNVYILKREAVPLLGVPSWENGRATDRLPQCRGYDQTTRLGSPVRQTYLYELEGAMNAHLQLGPSTSVDHVMAVSLRRFS